MKNEEMLSKSVKADVKAMETIDENSFNVNAEEEWEEAEVIDDLTHNEEGEVIDDLTHNNELSDVSSNLPSEKEDFPLKVDLGDADPNLFLQGILESGLNLGWIISLQLKGFTRKFDRAKLVGVDKDGLTVSYFNNEQKTYLYTDIKEVEVFHKGQKIATHELRYPMYGVSEENMKPYLRELTSGRETHVDVDKEDGQRLNAKLKVYRSKNEYSKGIVLMYAIYAAEKLEIKDIPNLNIHFTDEMKKELLEKGFILKPYEIRVKRKDGTLEERKYQIFIDKDLNVVRLQRIYPKLIEMRNVTLSESENNAVIKNLRENGFKDAWIDIDNPDKGISLNNSEVASASLIFKAGQKKVIPFLDVKWKEANLDGANKKAYLEKYEQSTQLTKLFLAKPKSIESKKVVSDESKEKQEIKNKNALKIS